MATNTTASFTNHTGNGTAGPFSISFSYLSEAEVDVFVGGVLKTITTHYTFTSATQITFTSGNEPANGAVIKIQRDTNIGAKKVDFNDGSVLTESDLDTQNDQLLFGLQELSDEYVKRNGTQSITGNLVFEGSTDDNNETTLAITDPTADRTITLPDRSGTVITSGDTGTVTSTMIEDGTIVNADVNASAAIAGTKVTPAFGSQNLSTTGTAATGALSVTGNIGVSGTVDGRDVAADGTKLDGIETAATADQTAAEIRTLVEAATDSNVFTDADHTKLNGIETGATADQTDAEIRTAVENATDSNVFTDADHTKLNGIEAGATADQTNSEIKTAYEANSDTNAFTDAEKTKLTGISTGADVTSSNSINALTDVNTSGVADGKILKYQASSSSFIIADDTGGSQGATTFTGLTDTPANYGNAANKTLKVNSSGNAVEFVDVTTSFAGLSDTPSSLSGQGGKTVKVNSGGTALEFETVTTDVVNDTTPQLGGNLDVQANEINTSTTNGNIKLNPNGTGVVEIKGDGSSADGTLQLNCSQNTHGVKIKSPPHSAGQSYTLTLPSGIVNGGLLSTDSNGNLGWSTSYVPSTGGSFTGQISAFGGILLGSNDIIKFDSDDTDTNHISFKGPTSLSSTVTYTLPEDGSNGQFLKTNGSGVLSFDTIDLTALSASNLTSGTVPDARFPATLPAASAANLTSIPAANITGTLPAIDGSALTGISGAKGGSGEAIFYESENTMDNDYTISTNHNALVAGPLTINATLTVNTNSVVTIP
tara:strand:- start:2082 stop:4388 length:2307 start_codon:yes stop_codon:yes gene_type:complete